MSQSLSERFKFSFKLRNSNSGEKMPSKKQYNLVQNDDYDTRVPLHSEEAFHHGITFQAKYIGTLDVPRPTSRVEIVAAMRRIRYEFKAKGIKKKKVSVEISVDGVRVTLKKKKKKKETSWDAESDSMELMHHPIYRIFYVSHDSSDLKIFSYIARDGVNNVFKCNVFKSNKKSQAMRIVRTVGQAFEVCHKLSPEPPPEAASSSGACDPSDQAALSISDKISEISDRPKTKEAGQPKAVEKGPLELEDRHQLQQLTLEPPPKGAHAQVRPQRPTHLDVDVSLAPARPAQQVGSREPTPGYTDRSIMTTPQATEHREKLLEESLEQQRQQTRAATAQLAMLNDQLIVEKAARVEAQARTHQLLLHNKELIDHISMLVAHLQERERGGAGSLPYSLSGHQLTSLPQPRSFREALELSGKGGERGSRLLHAPAPLVLDNRGLLDSVAALLPPLSPSLLVPRSPREAAFESNNNSSVASASAESPGAFPAYGQYSPYAAEPAVSPLARRYNNLNSLTSAAAYLDQQNANDLTDFLIDLVNQQPNGQLPQQHVQQQMNSQLQQQAFSRLNLYSGQSSPLQQRHGTLGPSPDHLFGPASAQQSPSMPRASDMRLSRSFMDSPALQEEAASGARDDCQFIRPLSQIGTITTLDEEGRVRIVVPTKKSPQPIITRTTSERVPNKNVLMAQVRDQWGRHTTK